MAKAPFVPSKAQKNRVAIAAGSGMAHEEIALALGICRNTLEKHFAFELRVGRAQKRMAVMEALHKAAMTGNVGAYKVYTSGALGRRTGTLHA